MASISVIVISYNNQETIRDCINSVLKNTEDCEVIVVDSASTDGTVKEIREMREKIKVIQSDQNLGFSKGNNLGVKGAKGEYLVFLNPDTRITKKGSLNKLVSDLEDHREYGLIGPRITYPDGRVQKTTRNLPSVDRAISEYLLGRTGSYDFYDPECDDLCMVDSVVGACMVIKKEQFERVGRFDERYFLYFEDLELCRQLLNQGLKVGYQPSVVIEHILGQSGKGGGVNKYLVESAKKYHGLVNFYIIQLIIRIGSKIRS